MALTHISRCILTSDNDVNVSTYKWQRRQRVSSLIHHKRIGGKGHRIRTVAHFLTWGDSRLSSSGLFFASGMEQSYWASTVNLLTVNTALLLTTSKCMLYGRGDHGIALTSPKEVRPKNTDPSTCRLFRNLLTTTSTNEFFNQNILSWLQCWCLPKALGSYWSALVIPKPQALAEWSHWKVITIHSMGSGLAIPTAFGESWALVLLKSKCLWIQEGLALLLLSDFTQSEFFRGLIRHSLIF